MKIPEIPESHPIFNALKSNDVDLVREYLAGGVNPHSLGLLDGALCTENIEIIQAFLDYGLDLSFPINKFGESPLLRSIEKKNLLILEFLIEKGSNLNEIAMGTTALHKAAAIWPEGAALLLRAGSDIHAKATDGRTSLMSAAHGNQVPSLEILAANGANLEDVDKEGTTALILAARAGNVEAATWLLDHGAKIHAKDKRGKTAEDWANKNGQHQIVELLQARSI